MQRNKRKILQLIKDEENTIVPPWIIIIIIIIAVIVLLIIFYILIRSGKRKQHTKNEGPVRKDTMDDIKKVRRDLFASEGRL